jgi:hypothetical protein
MASRDEMSDRQVAIQFDKLCKAYHAHWLVKDTKAFEEFCFCHSERIAKLLLKVTE